MINISAPTNSLGYGTIGCNLIHAINELGVNPSLFPVGGIECQKHHEEAISRSLERAQRFSHEGASLRVWHQWDVASRIGRGLHGCYPFFEVDPLQPNEAHQLSSCDVVFAPSSWAKGVMERSGVTTKIVVAQPGVDRFVFNSSVKPANLNVKPDTTVFANFGKWEVRKSHDLLVDIFNAAFSPKDEVLLVMCCFNPLRFAQFDGPAESAKWKRLYEESPLGRAGKILVILGRLPTQADVASLMQAADVGVFLSRAEGWGLETAEMMAMGKAVIATAYSAHTEYLNAENSSLIETEGLEEAYDGVFFHGGSGASWAKLGQKSFDQSVEALRALHKQKQERGSLSINAAGIEKFTWLNCAKKMLESLNVG